jgi:hypothetical protein
MLKPFNILLYLTIFFVMSSGCSKTEVGAPAANMSEYYPLQVGKYITYRLDSTVYINLNTTKVVRTYMVQDKIDAIVKDNLGNDAYRIRRTMRSNTDTTVWTDNATFLVIPSLRKTEFIENNLRFIKLINPVRDFTTWQGNSQINVLNGFLRFYENWEYFYEKTGDPFSVNNRNFPETVTVNHIDEVEGTPGDNRFFYEITRSSEVYAKGVGLIYKDFFHESWQPVTANFEPNSYGVRLTILNHNF